MNIHTPSFKEYSRLESVLTQQKVKFEVHLSLPWCWWAVYAKKNTEQDQHNWQYRVYLVLL